MTERINRLERHLTSSTGASSSNSNPSRKDGLSNLTNSEKQTRILAPEDVQNLNLQQLRERFGTVKKGALQLDGVNHVAFVCSNMATTIWFWSEALGLRLTKTLALPDGGQHFFLEGGRGAAIAYFWFKETPKPHPGVSSVNLERMLTEGKFSTAVGSVNHVAFNVSEDKLFEYRKRIQKTGVFVSPMLYHSDSSSTGYSDKKDKDTTWMSFYFTGPDGEYLELTSQTSREFTPETDVNHVPAHETKLEVL